MVQWSGHWTKCTGANPAWEPGGFSFSTVSGKTTSGVGGTKAAGHLQEAGLIRYRRGHIDVIDRPGLEARVCECYTVVRDEYDRLLGQRVPVRRA